MAVNKICVSLFALSKWKSQIRLSKKNQKQNQKFPLIILLHKGGHIVWQSSTSGVAEIFFQFMTIFFTVPTHTLYPVSEVFSL